MVLLGDHAIEVGAGIEASAAQADATQARGGLAGAVPGAAEVGALEGAADGAPTSLRLRPANQPVRPTWEVFLKPHCVELLLAIAPLLTACFALAYRRKTLAAPVQSDSAPCVEHFL